MGLAQPTVQFEILYDGGIISEAFPKVIVSVRNSNSIDVFAHVEVQFMDASNSIILKTIEKTSKVLPDLSFRFPVSIVEYYDIQTLRIRAYAYLYTSTEVSLNTVAEICESARSTRYVPLTTIPFRQSSIILKAFCNFPIANFKPVYACWEYSVDGVFWKEYTLHTSDESDGLKNISSDVEAISVSVQDILTHSHLEDVNESPPESEHTYVSRTMYKITATDSLDSFYNRVDTIIIPALEKLKNTLYRMRMCTVKAKVDEELESDYIEDVLLSMSVFTPTMSTEPEFVYSLVNTASKAQCYFYGNILYLLNEPSFSNNIIASFPGENVVPLSRSVPLNVLEDAYVTNIVPWKDFLVVYTSKSIHLVSNLNGEHTSKVINAHIGVPSKDSRCTVSSLNGVIFKSNYSVYVLYPNIYAGEDSVLNVTEISKPVNYILENFSNDDYVPFAIGTSSDYFLMLPHSKGTYCLVYTYSTKCWKVYSYTVIFTSYEMFSITDIRLFGYPLDENGVPSEYYMEYIFNTDLNNTYEPFDINTVKILPYADYIYPIGGVDDLNIIKSAARPIPFELDSGQKTDSMNFDKQFVESKFNVVTLHENDAFPMNVTVQIDGNPFVTKMDINTDSAFWKTSLLHKGVLSTDFASEHADLFNVFRQMYLRHSGKGRSIRYIIEGESMYPFKIYEIDYRYRNLNVKH